MNLGPRKKEGRRKCPRCGAELIRTSELYEVCPHGHGRLVPAAKPSAARVAAEDREWQRRGEHAARMVRKLQAEES